MPPRPRHSMISKCGKNLAMVSGAGGLSDGALFGPPADLSSLGKSVCVAIFIAIKQRAHNPAGELAGIAPPHPGQTGADCVLIPNTYRVAKDCYKISAFGENTSEITQFRVEFRASGQRLGNFFAI